MTIIWQNILSTIMLKNDKLSNRNGRLHLATPVICQARNVSSTLRIIVNEKKKMHFYSLVQSTTASIKVFFPWNTSIFVRIITGFDLIIMYIYTVFIKILTFYLCAFIFDTRRATQFGFLFHFGKTYYTWMTLQNLLALSYPLSN